MLRALKIVFAVNLIIAILLVGGYIWYGFAHALPIDQHFLGNARIKGHRTYNTSVAPWKYYAVVESGILIAFTIGRLARKEIAIDRLLSLVFGALGLIGLLQAWLVSSAYPSDEFENLHVATSDCMLGLYVFCSNLLYALFGCNNDDRTARTKIKTPLPELK